MQLLNSKPWFALFRTHFILHFVSLCTTNFCYFFTKAQYTSFDTLLIVYFCSIKINPKWPTVAVSLLFGPYCILLVLYEREKTLYFAYLVDGYFDCSHNCKGSSVPLVSGNLYLWEYANLMPSSNMVGREIYAR